MKKSVLLFLIMVTGLLLAAQTTTLNPGILCTQSGSFSRYETFPRQNGIVSQSLIKRPTINYKSTNAVSVIDLGTSADAWSMSAWTKSNLMINNDINAISFIHSMGGILDPFGSVDNLSYDISLDGGLTWSVMNKIYTAHQNINGRPYLDGAGFPHTGIYNPPGNTDPNNAYVVYYAPTYAGSNGPIGGICYGRGSIGDLAEPPITLSIPLQLQEFITMWKKALRYQKRVISGV